MNSNAARLIIMSLVLSGLTALAALKSHDAFASDRYAAVKKNEHKIEKRHSTKTYQSKGVNAEEAFKEFAANWMARLEKISKNNAKNVTPKSSGPNGTYSCKYVCYGPECRTSVKKTDSSVTPYIGMIYYSEKQILKKGANKQEAINDPGSVIVETPVTEIFRFSKGRWIY